MAGLPRPLTPLLVVVAFVIGIVVVVGVVIVVVVFTLSPSLSNPLSFSLPSLSLSRASLPFPARVRFVPVLTVVTVDRPLRVEPRLLVEVLLSSLSRSLLRLH